MATTRGQRDKMPSKGATYTLLTGAAGVRRKKKAVGSALPKLASSPGPGPAARPSPAVPEPRDAGPRSPSEVDLPGVPTEADVAAAVGPLTAADQQTFEALRRELAEHLGSDPAFRSWLFTPGTGYAGDPAAETIRRDPKSLVVLLDVVRSRRGPNPIYG